MRYKNFFLYFLPLILWFLGQVFLHYPKLFYLAIALGTLLIVLGSIYFLKRTGNKVCPAFIIPPLFSFLGFSFYATVLTNHFWLQIIFIFVAWFTFLYYSNLLAYLKNKREITMKRLDNTLLIGGSMTIFAVSAALYTMPAFLNWAFWEMLLVFIPLAFFLFIQFLPLRGMTPKTNEFLIFINVLVLSELVWALSLLPLNFNVLGALTTVLYYLLLSANRWYWRGDLNLKNIKTPLVIGAIIFFLLLLTATWL